MAKKSSSAPKPKKKLTPQELSRKAYFGMSGHHYGMSEFLIRGYNVAIPEVDVGDDVIVIEDDLGNLTRVQVKSVAATPNANKKGYYSQVNLRVDQLQATLNTKLFYLVLIRHGENWITTLMISREDLNKEYEAFKAAKKNAPATTPKQLTLRLSLSDDFKAAKLWKKDFSEHLGNWTAWPSKLPK